MVTTGGLRRGPRRRGRARPRSSRVLATPGLSFGETGPQVDGPGGDPNPARSAPSSRRCRWSARPACSATCAPPSTPAARRCRRPRSPSSRRRTLPPTSWPPLVDEGGTVRTLDDISTSVERQSGAVQAWMYAVMAGCCLLVALLALLAAGGRQRAAYRRDVASLRVVGVPTRRDPVGGAGGAGAAGRRGRGRRGRGRPARGPAAARGPAPGRGPGVRDPAGPGVLRAAGAGDRAGARRDRRPRRGAWPAHRPRADPSVDPARGGGDR